jgi:hypothetical protein
VKGGRPDRQEGFLEALSGFLQPCLEIPCD